MLHPPLAFEREGLGGNRHGKRAEFAGKIRNHGRSAASGAAAEAGGDENHVRAVERFENFLGVLKRGLAADFGICSRAQSFCKFCAQLQFHRRLRKLERLQIRVGRDEFHAFHLGANHAVDGVTTAAPHTDYFYLRAVLYFLCK